MKPADTMPRILRCLIITQMLSIPLAMAQEAENHDATTLDQINVTARQRSERLQDVPIAVSAFNAADIRNAGISNPRDFVALTSNVTYIVEQGTGTAFITIRGISQVRNSEQPVAVVIDGVPQMSGRQFQQELFDIAQIEVLKGPQGAMYGNNSLGGAINITTVEPGDSFGGFLQLGAGNGDLWRAQGSFGAPLERSGRWRGQASVLYSNMDKGLFKNRYLNKNVGALESKNARLRLIGQISDTLNLDIQASASDENSDAAITFVYQPLFTIPDAGNAKIPITTNNLNVTERGNSQISAKLDWQHAWGTFSSITAWSRTTEFFAGDQFPYSPATTLNPDLVANFGGDGTQTLYEYSTGLTQEFRLTSRSDQRLRWIVGAFGQWIDRYVSISVGEDLEQGLAYVRRAPLPPGSHSPTTSFLADDSTRDTSAVFGQLGYDLSPRLEAALALRYDRAKRSQTDVAPAPFSANPGLSRTATFTALQPKVSLTFKPRSNLSAFASIGRGFNSGGFNQTGTGALAAAAGIAGADDLYEKSIADSYELGLKSRPLPWLEFNASVFHTDLENQHYFVIVPEVQAQIIAPISKTRLQGVELEIKAVPLRNLTLLGGLGYTDSEIRENLLDPSAVGNRSPYVPRTTLNLGTQYKAEIGDIMNAVLRVDYRRMGEQYWDTQNSSARPAINLVDARLSLQSVSGTWALTFWGRNLTNKRYLAEWLQGGFARHALPRAYGVDVRMDF